MPAVLTRPAVTTTTTTTPAAAAGELVLAEENARLHAELEGGSVNPAAHEDGGLLP